MCITVYWNCQISFWYGTKIESKVSLFWASLLFYVVCNLINSLNSLLQALPKPNNKRGFLGFNETNSLKVFSLLICLLMITLSWLIVHLNSLLYCLPMFHNFEFVAWYFPREGLHIGLALLNYKIHVIECCYC